MARHCWRWLCPAVALAVITMTVEAQQETGFLNRTVTTGGNPLRYQVYIPFDYTPAKRWPVILFLHGAGERGTDGIRQTEVGLGTAIRRNAGWFPAIVVLPQAPPDSIWRGSVAQGRWPRWSDRSASFTVTEPGSTWQASPWVGTGRGRWRCSGRLCSRRLSRCVADCFRRRTSPSSK